MKILFILTEFPYPPHKNGLALINYEILRNSDENCEIDIVVPCKKNEINERELKLLAPNVNNIFYLSSSYTKYYKLINLISGAILGKNIIDIGNINNIIRERKIIYDSYYAAPMFTYFNVEALSKKLFLNAVDSFSLLALNGFKNNKSLRNYLKYRLYLAYEKNIFKTPGIVNFVSSIDLLHIEGIFKKGSTKFINISNAVDTNLFPVNLNRREPFTLLFTGNFSYYPNSEGAIYFAKKILPELLKINPLYKFYVVGKAPPAEIIGLPGVIATGFVDDISQYYSRCALFVCPLLSGAGVKNKILEAMSSGIPVITTKLGVDGIEGINEDIHYSLAYNKEQFVNIILNLSSEEFKMNKMAVSAYEYILNRSDWVEISHKYLNAIKGL